jgi:hypothetical protein
VGEPYLLDSSDIRKGIGASGVALLLSAGFSKT